MGVKLFGYVIQMTTVAIIDGRCMGKDQQRRGKRFNSQQVHDLINQAVHRARFDMIIRLTGGQHIQVINTYDHTDDRTKYRARKTDSNGRKQGELTPWFDSFDEAVREALLMEGTGPFG